MITNKRTSPYLFLHEGAHLERNLEAFLFFFEIRNLEAKQDKVVLQELFNPHLLGDVDAVLVGLGRAFQVRDGLQDKETIHGGDLAALLVSFSPGYMSFSQLQILFDELPGHNIGFVMTGGGGNGPTARCRRRELLVGHRVRRRWTTMCFRHLEWARADFFTLD